MLLLPGGEVVPPYARPAAEALAFVALEGSVGVRTLTWYKLSKALALQHCFFFVGVLSLLHQGDDCRLSGS